MKNKQFHLFDDEVTLIEVKPPMTQDIMLQKMADGIADTLIKNGVRPEHQTQMITKMLSSSFKKGSPSYNRVLNKVKNKLKGGDLN